MIRLLTFPFVAFSLNQLSQEHISFLDNFTYPLRYNRRRYTDFSYVEENLWLMSFKIKRFETKSS